MNCSFTSNDADPDPNPSADLDTMAVYNVLRTAASLGSEVEGALRSTSLTAARLNALLALRDAGDGGMPMGELGRRLVVTKSNITGLVDRLERKNLAERLPGTDRRSTNVRITEHGQQVLTDVLPDHEAAMQHCCAGLSQRDKKQLAQILTRMRRHLRRAKHQQEAH